MALLEVVREVAGGREASFARNVDKGILSLPEQAFGGKHPCVEYLVSHRAPMDGAEA